MSGNYSLSLDVRVFPCSIVSVCCHGVCCVPDAGHSYVRVVTFTLSTVTCRDKDEQEKAEDLMLLRYALDKEKADEEFELRKKLQVPVLGVFSPMPNNSASQVSRLSVSELAPRAPTLYTPISTS